MLRTLTRGLGVLQALNSNNGASLNALVRETRISRGAVHRILGTLAAEGYVSNVKGHYFIEPRLRILSAGLADGLWLSSAQTTIEDLGCEVRWPVAIARSYGLAMETCALTDSRLRHRRVGVGVKVPMVCSAAGRAYVAFLPENMRAQIIEILAGMAEFPEDQELCRNPREVMDMLAGIAQTGLATVAVGRGTLISVPIIQPNGEVLGALSLRYFTASIKMADVLRLNLAKMQATARRIARWPAEPGERDNSRA